VNLLAAMNDENLFARWFQRGEWTAWRAFLAALFALDMSEEEEAIYHNCTGRLERRPAPFNEAWLVCGRRGGKSFIMALAAVYLACFKDYREYLAPGERATIFCIAADRKQARTIFRYIAALLNEVPMLKRMIERETAESFELNNRVIIEVGTASFRSIRGYTLAGCLCDEVAFWHSDGSATPDYEVLDALRPGMATIPGAVLLCASSPYAKRGALYDAHRRYYGKDTDVLVWQAPTRVMNPSVPQSVIDSAMERDPAHASAEYLAKFRDDIESFVSRETVEACIEPERRERPPVSGVKYSAFVDPSGGSSDSMTLAIAHMEDGKAVLDCLRERKPPFKPTDVVADFTETLQSYGVRTITGDKYAGEWPREQFREKGVFYDASAKPKSDLYRDLLPALNGSTCELLDNDKLVTQLSLLERRTSRAGRDSIDHPPGGHDDVANAVAGVLAGLTTTPKKTAETVRFNL